MPRGDEEDVKVKALVTDANATNPYNILISTLKTIARLHTLSVRSVKGALNDGMVAASLAAGICRHLDVMSDDVPRMYVCRTICTLRSTPLVISTCTDEEF